MAPLDSHQARDHWTIREGSNDKSRARGRGGWPGGHPLVTIWTEPRATMRQILETNPTYLVIMLACAWGVLQAIDRAAQRKLGDTMATPGLLGMIFVLGPAGGIFSLYVFGRLWSWAGRMLGGVGDAAAVRAAIAWGETPALAGVAIRLVQLAVIGPELFTKTAPNLSSSPGLRVFYLGGLIALFILAVWTFFLSLKCVGEAHRFSAWRALGAIILGTLPFIALVAGMVGLLILLEPA